MLLGFGRVGRALADQIGAPNGRAVRVVGLLDRSGYVFEPRGLSARRLAELAREKDQGALLSALGGKKAPAGEALAFMASHAVSQPVVVDVTSEETGDLLRTALGHGFDVVLANKKPLAGSWKAYEALMDTAARTGRRVRYEATVGAGLPIIDTFHKLVETGDRVLRVEGVVSGTLMFVASAVSAGRPFSEAVREAVERGYAEPDPTRRSVGRRRGAQSADPRAAAGLSRAGADAGGSRAALRSAACRSKDFMAQAAGGRSRMGRAHEARSRARPRAALRRDRHRHAARRRGSSPCRRRARSARSRARATSSRSRPGATAASRS